MMRGLLFIFWLTLLVPVSGMDTLMVSTVKSGVALPNVSDWPQDSMVKPALPAFGPAIRHNRINSYRYCFINDSPETYHAAIWTDDQYADLLYLTLSGNEVADTIYSGVMIPKYARRQLIGANLMTFSMSPGDTVLVTLSHASSFGIPYSGHFYLTTQEDYYHMVAESSTLDKLGHGISMLFMGSALVLMLYTMMLYFQNRRDVLYLHYSTYLFFAIWYFSQKLIVAGPYYILYPNLPALTFTINELLQILLLVFYNLFIIAVLDLDQHDKKLARLIRHANKGYLLYALLEFTYVIVTNDGTLRAIVYPISRIIIFSLSLYFLYRISSRWKLLLVRYVVIGSLLFMFFSVLATLFSMNMHWTAIVPLYPINFMHMGVFLEAIFFSLAMGYRIRLNTKKRTRYYKAYVRQLENNQSIIDEANTQLELEVKERTKEKDDLMGIMVHDLRRPLANSIGLVDLMEKGRKKEEVTPLQYYEMLRQQLQASMAIIQDVMNMHRAHEKVDTDASPGTDIQAIVAALVGIYTPDAQEKNITIHQTIGTDIPPVVQDEAAVKRILDNLISNAVKYCYLNKSIDIAVENKEGAACVRITDSGPGIPPDEADKLFRKFSKLSTRPTNNEASSGMGLYLTKMLCDKLGATLQVYNVAGRGACFEVRF